MEGKSIVYKRTLFYTSSHTSPAHVILHINRTSQQINILDYKFSLQRII